MNCSHWITLPSITFYTKSIGTQRPQSNFPVVLLVDSFPCGVIFNPASQCLRPGRTDCTLLRNMWDLFRLLIYATFSSVSKNNSFFTSRGVLLALVACLNVRNVLVKRCFIIYIVFLMCPCLECCKDMWVDVRQDKDSCLKSFMFYAFVSLLWFIRAFIFG